MIRRLAAAALIVGQLTLAYPSLANAPVHAQTFGGAAPSAGAAVDLSGYTPTSGLSAVVRANAPVQPSDLSAAGAAANTYTDNAVAGLNTSLGTDAAVAQFGNRMASLGVLATPAQVTAAANAARTGAVAAIPDTSSFITLTQATAAAPVQSVNGGTGAVTVATFARQQTPTPLTPDAAGNITFTFAPTPVFKVAPGCYTQIATTTAGYSFLQPTTTALSTAAVSMNVRAVPNAVTVNALGAALPLTTPPPAGTTVTVFCIAPN